MDENDPTAEAPPRPSVLWWAKHLAGAGLGCVFLAFGVEVLVAAYGLNDPFSFVMTFFAANFMILISAALTFGLVWRMVSVLRGPKPGKPSP